MLDSPKEKLEKINKKLIPHLIEKLVYKKGSGTARLPLYRMLFQNVESLEHVAMLIVVLLKISSEKCEQFVNVFKKRMGSNEDKLYWAELYKALHGIDCFGLKEHALFIVQHGKRI